MATPPTGGHPIALGALGSTALQLVFTKEPWTVPVDAYTLPAGVALSPSGPMRATLDGGLARRLRDALGPTRWDRLQRLVSEKNARVGFGPARPLLVELPEELRLGGPGRLIVGTAFGPEPTVAHAAQAAAAIAKGANAEGLRRIAISLLGSGDGGLDSAAVAVAMLEAVLRAGPFEALEEVSLTTTSENVVELSPLLETLVVKVQDERSAPAVKQGTPYAPPPTTPAPAPSTPAPSISVAATGSDDPWASGLDDRLGVGEEAKAFARLAAAARFQPPLAVGVFGEWGSGKSFFMRLVHEHVARLAGGRWCAEAPEAEDGAFLRGIVQVRFNAWHYVDTNLWASLVDHLFGELDRWVRARQEPKAADALLENISTARELTLEAAEQLVRHRKEQRDAAERLARAEQVLTGARASAAGSASVWWAALREAVQPAPDGPANAELARSEEDFKRAAAKLGLEDVTKNAQAFEVAAEALASEAKRAQLLRRGLLDQLQRPWAVALLVVACLAAPAAFVEARDWLGHWISGLDQVPALLAGLSGLLASATAIVGWTASRARSALSLLERSKAAMDAAVAEQIRSPGEDVKKSQARLTKVTAEVEEARALLAATSDRLAEATREYTSGTGTGRLLRFIRARATDGQYARHLGLIASIRKDFEELAAGLAAASKQSRDDVEKARAVFRRRVAALLWSSRRLLAKEERRKLVASAKEPPPAQEAFQRIVLYIDDLDRCPPRKVVEVLQAVHMLLTFPLFVVVVAVDVRWVSRALERHYPDLLEPTGGRRAGPGRAASAHDYLEKIFQIPYWVRGMTEQASRDFLEDRSKGLVAAPIAGAPEVAAADAGAVVPRAIVAPAGSPERSVATASIPSGSPAAALPSPSPSPSAAPADVAAASNASAPPGPERSQTSGAPASAPLDARALALDAAEREFIGRLAPFVGGSPRRALRFLNVYCVVKASLGKADLDALQAGGYRALMTQLAIATGAPQSLSAWLDGLRAATSLEAARAGLDHDPRARDGADRARLAQALGVYAAASSDASAQVKDLLAYASIARRYSFTG